MEEQKDYVSPSLLSLEQQESKDTYYIPELKQTIEAGEFASERDIEINALKKMAGKNNNAFLMGMRNLDEPVSPMLFDKYGELASKNLGIETDSSAMSIAKGFGEATLKSIPRTVGWLTVSTVPLIVRAGAKSIVLKGTFAGRESEADKFQREVDKGVESFIKDVKKITGIEDADKIESFVLQAEMNIGASLVTGSFLGQAAVAPIYGLSASEETYSKQREAGVGVKEAELRSIWHGLGEAGFEYLQFNRILGSFTKRSKPFKILKDLAENAFQESLQQSNELAANWNIDNRSLGEKILEVLVSGVGGAIGSLTGSIGGIVLDKMTIKDIGNLMERTGHTDEEIKTVKDSLNKIADSEELARTANMIANDELTTLALTHGEQAQAMSEELVNQLDSTIRRNELVDVGGPLHKTGEKGYSYEDPKAPVEITSKTDGNVEKINVIGKDWASPLSKQIQVQTVKDGYVISYVDSKGVMYVVDNVEGTKKESEWTKNVGTGVFLIENDPNLILTEEQKNKALADLGIQETTGEMPVDMPPLYQLGELQVDTQKNPSLGMVLYQAEQVGKPFQTLGQVLEWANDKMGVEKAQQLYSGKIAVYQKTYNRLKELGQDDLLADRDAQIRASAATRAAKRFNVSVEEADKTLGSIEAMQASEFKGQPQLTKYQFIGQKANLTEEQRTARDVAEEMEKAGKTPTEIWEKTLWMKDEDGEWKFETDDSKASLIETDGLKKYTESVPLYNELSELMKRKYELEDTGLENSKQYKDVSKRLNELNKKSIMFLYETRLGDLLDYKELFRLYPKLRNMRVTFEELDSGRLGEYSYLKNNIRLSPSLVFDKTKILSTLMHEIQHYIQRVEGFARGGSPEEFTDEIMKQIKEQEEKIFNERVKKESIKNLKQFVSEEQAKDIVKMDDELRNAYMDELAKGTREYAKIREQIEEKWQNMLQSLNLTEQQVRQAMYHGTTEERLRADRISSLTTQDQFYERLLGEIEARNTEKRLGYTEEQRRKTPPFFDREFIGEEIIVKGKTGKVMQPEALMQYQKGTPKGAYYNNTIYLFENADQSTFVHEMAHAYMDMLNKFAYSGNVNAQEDLNVIRKWLGKKQGQDFTRADWERFAVGFEMYLREGKAPNKSLGGIGGVFDTFKGWLLDIYTDIKEMFVINEKGQKEPVKINQQIKDFYDEMLGGEDIDNVIKTAQEGGQALQTLQNKMQELADMQQVLAEERAKLVREMANSVKPDSTWANVKDWGNNLWESARELPTNVLQSSYARLAKIDPRLGLLVQRAEQSQGLRIKRWTDQIKPFYEAFNKLSAEDKAKVQFYLLNQQWGEVEDLIGQENTDAVRNMLKTIYDELIASGVDVGYRDNYFPRSVLDYDGLLQEMGLTYPALRKEMEEAIGKDATPEEQAEWLDKHIMGFKGGNVSTKGNKYTKERKLDLITDTMAQYYKPSMETLVNYVEGMAKLLSMREAFGKDIEYKEGKDSIGKIIENMLGEKNLTKKQIDEVRHVLSALYLPNGMGNKFLQAMRQYGYATKLSYSTTIRQFADIGMMMKVNGVLNTLDALFHPDKRITLENLGIDPLGEEFQTSKKDIGGKIANFSTKWKGINWADAVMKNAFMRGSYKALQQLAKTPEKFHEKYDSLFGDETDTIIKDLNENKLSEPVKVLLFHEISKIQPISRSAMPAAYLSNPNGRVLYMFKTFSLHRAEYMVSELAEDFRRGDFKKAGKDIMADVAVIGWEGLVELLIAFLKYGWQAFAAQEVLDTFAGAGLGVFGLNKHQALQLSRGQLGDFFQEMAFVGTPVDDIMYMIRHYDDEDKLLRAFLPDMIIEPLIAGPKPISNKTKKLR